MISESVNFDPMVSELAALSCPALSQKKKSCEFACVHGFLCDGVRWTENRPLAKRDEDAQGKDNHHAPPLMTARMFCLCVCTC